jgi:hypothetical protein
MLAQWQPELLGVVVAHLREQRQEVLPAQWETAGYVVFAGDGSRVALARNESLAAARHKKAASPQLWLTLLWHVGSGLPWVWRMGPSGASEREPLVALVPELPAQALSVTDAGFVGYDLWQTLLTASHHFVIRVGANVRLVRQLGGTREHAQSVYVWPDQAARKRQPPLGLRLVVVHDSKQPVYLVTNLPQSRLSDRQVATIYGARWGIEVFFRTFKQTFGYRKLRSRSAPTAQLELAWALLGLWSVCLLGSRELSASGHEACPVKPRRGHPRLPTHAPRVSRTARDLRGHALGAASPRSTG